MVDEGKRRRCLIRVPEEMMNDIVRRMWGSLVEVVGRRKGRYTVLEDIREVGARGAGRQ